MVAFALHYNSSVFDFCADIVVRLIGQLPTSLTLSSFTQSVLYYHRLLALLLIELGHFPTSSNLSSFVQLVNIHSIDGIAIVQFGLNSFGLSLPSLVQFDLHLPCLSVSSLVQFGQSHALLAIPSFVQIDLVPTSLTLSTVTEFG